ncbi:hypothetical protein San01_33900 [Streptomyces angustmyceticus]|uniref:Uncharacterized protein n=2 Tax=Streptomyces angustmyceticus TaxID=285578 RepID=A0A5J4L9P3_9ACTN|nr:hypothetical protein San01_33900 [Streptomyces angustmyceticus]
MQGVTPTGRHRPDGPVVRTPRSIRTREPRRRAGPMRVALLIPVAALLVLVSGALGSFRWMLVPSLVLGAAGGIWLIVAVPRLLPDGALSRLMTTLLAAAATSPRCRPRMPRRGLCWRCGAGGRPACRPRGRGRPRFRYGGPSGHRGAVTGRRVSQPMVTTCAHGGGVSGV